MTIRTSQFLPCPYTVFFQAKDVFKGLMFNPYPANQKNLQRLNETGRWLHRVLFLSRARVPPTQELFRSAGT